MAGKLWTISWSLKRAFFSTIDYYLYREEGRVSVGFLVLYGIVAEAALV